jgi:hypothetical protein
MQSNNHGQKHGNKMPYLKQRGRGGQADFFISALTNVMRTFVVGFARPNWLETKLAHSLCNVTLQVSCGLMHPIANASARRLGSNCSARRRHRRRRRWQSRLKIKQYRSPTFFFTPLQDT